MNTPPLSLLRRMPASASIALLLLISSTPAHAMQRCSIDGRLVLQATPCAVEAALPAPPPAMLADASQEAPKRKLADALREREADNRTRAAKPARQLDGASILPARMGAL